MDTTPPGVARTGSLRVARDSDHAGLLELAVDFYQEDGFTTSRDDLARNLSGLVHSAAAHVAVVEHDGRLVAFAITTTSSGLENGLIAELEDLYVAPSERRRGWAGRLIVDAAGWASRRGAAALEVVTAPNGQDVEHLNVYYEARGFVYEGRQLRTRSLT